MNAARIAGVGVAAVAGAAIVFVVESQRRDDGRATLPAPAQPAFAIPRPTPLGSARNSTRWASVLRSAPARSGPSSRSTVVARLGATTPEGTSNLVIVLQNTVRLGQPWVRVRLPVLPNNTTGWVPRSALGGYRIVRTRLVVDRSELTATLWRDGRIVFRAPIGIGRPEWPTPSGEFYIRNRLRDFRSAFYGPLAFGTSARSSVLTDWPAGGFIGIHGTNEPELLPGQVSHGCIRMRNEDILVLGRLMPVGTPLTIT